MSERILVVDDDADFCSELARTLERRGGYVVTTSTDADEAERLASSESFDLVITDLRMGVRSGVDLCRRVTSARPDLPVIVATGFGSLEAAVETMRAGAFDFLTKPFAPAQLDLAVKRALGRRCLVREVAHLRTMVSAVNANGPIVGRSPAMLDVLELIAQVAPTSATVLVTGESGTGKELVARALHDQSPRSSGPFVAVNCAAIPESLLESELFGHVKGAFTDAKTTKRGLVFEASGGTLFLDEIGELPLSMQAKLLRALEERQARPLGATAEARFDARIVAATNRDIESRVAEGSFRADLYFRVNVVHLELPPLRSRGDDILLLAGSFVSKLSDRHGKRVFGLGHDTAARLLAYPWPGNVRELQNAIERAVAVARTEELLESDLPMRIREYRANDILVPSSSPEELCTLEELERRYITAVMTAVQGSKTEAARILGLDRSTLYRKLDRIKLPG